MYGFAWVYTQELPTKERKNEKKKEEDIRDGVEGGGECGRQSTMKGRGKALYVHCITCATQHLGVVGWRGAAAFGSEMANFATDRAGLLLVGAFAHLT